MQEGGAETAPPSFIFKSGIIYWVDLCHKIFNVQFPDKTGFTLRFNPATGICAALRPSKLVRAGIILIY
jgi:hypothetical protein